MLFTLARLSPPLKLFAPQKQQASIRRPKSRFTLTILLLSASLYVAIIGFSIGDITAQYRGEILMAHDDILNEVRPSSGSLKSSPVPMRRSLNSKRIGIKSLAKADDRHLFHTDPTGHEQVSQSRTTPRAVALELLPNNNKLRVAYTAPKSSDNLKCCSAPIDPPIIDSTWYTPNAKEMLHGYEDLRNCEPVHDWQLESYPDCNRFHELDYHQMRLINKGGARIAFELKQYLDNSETKFVYKTVIPQRKLILRMAEEQRKDSLVMDRLVVSPFIPDLHGYCGFGVLMDFMPQGNLHDYVKGARLDRERSLAPVDKLRVAIHVASAVADLHTKALYFHNDVDSNQILFQDGIFKLNDFNIADPLYVNTTNNRQCTRGKYYSDSWIWKGRSLEDFQRVLGYKQFTPPEPQNVDLWMLGNVIYTILTNRYPFEEVDRAVDVGKRLIAGERSPIPKDILNSNDPSYVAMKKSLDMAWTYKWQARPSARSISDYLLGQLRGITGVEDPDLRVELPERDPNQRGTNSDFMRANCDRTKDSVIKKNCS